MQSPASVASDKNPDACLKPRLLSKICHIEKGAFRSNVPIKPPVQYQTGFDEQEEKLAIESAFNSDSSNNPPRTFSCIK